MNLNYAEISGKGLPNNLLGDKVAGPNWSQGAISKSEYAYALRWDDYYAPKLLNAILSHGLIAKVANESFTSGTNIYSRGTIIIPVPAQKNESG